MVCELKSLEKPEVFFAPLAFFDKHKLNVFHETALNIATLKVPKERDFFLKYILKILILKLHFCFHVIHDTHTCRYYFWNIPPMYAIKSINLVNIFEVWRLQQNEKKSGIFFENGFKAHISQNLPCLWVPQMSFL